MIYGILDIVKREVEDDRSHTMTTTTARAASREEETRETAAREKEATGPAMKLFGPTVIRFTEGGKVWMMSREDGGWNRFGYCYPSLPALLDAWDVEVGLYGRDEHSHFLRVTPAR
jgi:hypothetical protein